MIKTMKIVSEENGDMQYKRSFPTLIDLDRWSFTATITGDFKTIECTARMIVIVNSQNTGVTINPNGAMDDGVWISYIENLDLVVLKIISGNMPLDSVDVEIISTDKAIS
jgi:hypothetical protein